LKTIHFRWFTSLFRGGGKKKKDICFFKPKTKQKPTKQKNKTKKNPVEKKQKTTRGGGFGF